LVQIWANRSWLIASTAILVLAFVGAIDPPIPDPLSACVIQVLPSNATAVSPHQISDPFVSSSGDPPMQSA
jgi:hypothetical protein